MKTVREQNYEQQKELIQEKLQKLENKMINLDDEYKSELDDLYEQKKELVSRLVTLDQLNQSHLQCANLRCDITNTIMRKYQTFQETNYTECLYQLRKMYDCLIEHGFLTEQDFKENL